MVTALALNLCAASPLTEPDQDIPTVTGDLAHPTPLNITVIPGNSSTDGLPPIKIPNMCYHWSTSERWVDVGGHYSAFVNQSVIDLCTLVAFDAYNGFPAGNMVRHIPTPKTLFCDLISSHLISTNAEAILTNAHYLPTRPATARKSPREHKTRTTTAASPSSSGTGAPRPSTLG